MQLNILATSNLLQILRMARSTFQKPLQHKNLYSGSPSCPAHCGSCYAEYSVVGKQDTSQTESTLYALTYLEHTRFDPADVTRGTSKPWESKRPTPPPFNFILLINDSSNHYKPHLNTPLKLHHCWAERFRPTHTSIGILHSIPPPPKKPPTSPRLAMAGCLKNSEKDRRQ